MCTGRGSNQGPLGPKSDALTTAPLRHLSSNSYHQKMKENVHAHSPKEGHKRSSMSKPRIFPKSLKQRGQIFKWVNLETFQLYDFDLYVNHLKSYHTLFTKVNRQR